jgi:glycosyltransferase involved in cell wall biosynthesis
MSMMNRENEDDEKARFETVVISRYPISQDDLSLFAAPFERDVKIVVVSAIVKNGTRSLFRQLRQINCKNLYVFLSSESDEPLLPALIFLASQMSAQSRFISIGEAPPVRINKFALPSAILKLVTATVTSSIKSIYVAVRCDRLMQKPRVMVDDRKVLNNNFVMIKLTLWFGMQTGGALTHFLGISRAAQRAGNNVTTFSTDYIPPSPNDEGIAHKQVIPPTAYVTPRELNHFGAHLFFLRQIEQELRGFKGIVYQRVSVGNFLGVEISRLLRVPLIAEFNGSEIWLSENWGTPYFFSKTVEKIELLMLRHAHLVVVVSLPLKRQLIDLGIEAERVVVVKNGFDVTRSLPASIRNESRARLRDQFEMDQDAVVFCFVGTFGPWHGVGNLAKSIARFFSIHGETNIGQKARFLLVGDGVGREAVETILQSQIDANQVIMTGGVKPDSINEYLAASDVCLLPTTLNKDGTEFFGSPTKLFEYMGAAKAIIATEVGQVTEILQGAVPVDRFDELADSQNKEQCAIMVPPGSVRKLVDAYAHIVKAPKWTTKAGLHAQQRAEEKYTWDQSFKEISEKLTEVLERQNVAPKVNLLINALHSKSGGGVTYLRNILPILCADQRLDIHLCLNEKQMTLFEPWLDEVTLHKVKLDDTLWRTVLYEQFSLPSLARELQADVTFSPANYGPIFAPNTVVLLRNALSVAFVERRLPKILYWAMLYLGTVLSVFAARNVISVSEYARKATLTGLFGGGSAKFQTIPHGISTNFEADTSTIREENSLLFVSDIYVQKNLHGFFNSLSILKKQFPDIKLRVAGAPVDSDYNDRITTLMHELQLGDVVEFLGNLDSALLTQEYRRTTVFVFPSTVETFGNPLVEAMACGAPIACSNTAAMPEVAGEAAEYFDPHDAEDMARVVEKLLNDEGRRVELSRLGIERAKKYSWEETARKTADVLIDAARN